MKLDPPIGVPRTYTDRVTTLYPGESAWFEIGADRVAEIIAENVSDHPEQPFRVALTGTWRVTPMPGLYGWLLRTQYRLRVHVRHWAQQLGLYLDHEDTGRRGSE